MVVGVIVIGVVRMVGVVSWFLLLLLFLLLIV